jgi:hypothetical protein
MLHRCHARRARLCLLGFGMMLTVLAQNASSAFAIIGGQTEKAVAASRFDISLERRCKWAPKEEHCYWVKTDTKRHGTH